MRTTAVATRFIAASPLTPRAFAEVVVVAVAEPAVAALALLIFGQAFEQVDATEIRPQRRRYVNFRVRQLPQEEVAEAHLAAGADHKIGVGKMARVEML